MKNRFAGASIVALLVAVALVSFTAPGRAAEGDISGVVTSANGPEEGVWVIAETTSLPTKFVKTVVTGDGGRYLIPELPDATYEVWVRGYGLVDSAKVTATPGDTVDLEATVAPTPADAAKVYPANYWYSLIEPPLQPEFPGTGEDGNGIAANLRHQEQWVDIQKQGCMLCHQLGNRITREIDNIAQFDSSLEAWNHRVQMGQRGSQMTNAMNRFGREAGLRMFADWTDRIATGGVPPAPPRPQGMERNVVVSMWEWGTEIDYIHDEITTDKRDPRVNANGPVYGVNISNDKLAILDPVTHVATNLNVPLRVDPSTVPGMIARSQPRPSRFFGDELIWNDPANPHNPMMDQKGRVWMTSAIRNRANPDYCKEGSDNPYAKYYPLPSGFRSGGVLRAGDREVRDGRHLLRDPSPAVRRGRERHALLQRRRPGHRLDRHEALRRDGRRADLAGLVPDRARHERRRRNHEAVERAPAAARRGPASRPRARYARRRGQLRRHRRSDG